MTKPLIEQLAERIGVSMPDPTYGLTTRLLSKLLFELCAYLDEHRARIEPGEQACTEHDRCALKGCPGCDPQAPALDGLGKGHGSTVTRPPFCMKHARQEPCIYCVADSANDQAGSPGYVIPPPAATEPRCANGHDFETVLVCERCGHREAVPEVAEVERKNKGTSLYPRHALHTLEPHYSRHVGAMTSDGLHHKSDIAEQLAWRDHALAGLRDDLSEAREALRAAEQDAANWQRWFEEKTEALARVEGERDEASNRASRWTGESVGLGASAIQLCDIVDGLRAELAKVTAERDELDEELQQLDDLIAELGGEREQGAANFIGVLVHERGELLHERDELRAQGKALAESTGWLIRNYRNVVEAARLAAACLTEHPDSDHSAAIVLRKRVIPALSALDQPEPAAPVAEPQHTGGKGET